MSMEMEVQTLQLAFHMTIRTVLEVDR